MGIKIFDFCCANGHLFEGWFKSDEAWQTECREGRFVCPVCGDKRIQKRPSASRISQVKGTTREEVAKDVKQRDLMKAKDLQARAMTVLREVAEKTEDVGERFPEEVRASHEGRKPPRLVRGQCSFEEAEALREDGIPVVPLPDAVLKPLS